MNRSRRGSGDDGVSISFSDTLIDIFGEKENRIHSELKDDARYRQFQQKFREINKFSENKLIPHGETLQLIYMQFGSSLDGIQFGILNEVKDFVEKNITQRYAFICPELDAFLKLCGYYEKSKTSVAPKPMVAGYCSTVVKMMSKKCTPQQFIDFGIEVSKI